jgi:threonine dehydrogenase-like Zn-dependent dehydrogenase
MLQLTFLKPKSIEWHEVEEPKLTDNESVIVRPLTVSSCDFDGAAINGMIRMPGPTPLGHEGEGVIIEVGKSVNKWQKGDRVIMPWKIACGTCPNCKNSHSAQCESTPEGDSFSWGPIPRGGFMSDAVSVPYADFNLTRLPDNVDPVLTCGVADNITDAWRAVGPHLKQRPGGTVLVAAAQPPGSIALYTAGIAVALGSKRVVYADTDQSRLDIAARMGAEPLFLSDTALDEFATNRHSLLGGFDITVDAWNTPLVIAQLIAATARAGVLVSTAGIMYRKAEVKLDLYAMYRKSISLFTGWVHTHSIINEPLRLIANGQFDPSPVTSRIVNWVDAKDALLDPFVKVILSRPS